MVFLICLFVENYGLVKHVQQIRKVFIIVRTSWLLVCKDELLFNLHILIKLC